ncbi:response regulator [Marinicauda algicola]|nr:response regulator [Marinicauda algicola]
MADEVDTSMAFKRLNILVVDDNAAMRGLVRTVLTAFGCEMIFEASTAQHCVEVLRAKAIDIIVLDWKMKPVDGISLVKLLRNPNKSPNPYVPIIMLTAYAELSKVREARDAGVTEFMAKPFSADALYRRIQSIVNRPRPFVRTKVFFGPDRRRLAKPDYEGPERRDDEVQSA